MKSYEEGGGDLIYRIAPLYNLKLSLLNKKVTPNNSKVCPVHIEESIWSPNVEQTNQRLQTSYFKYVQIKNKRTRQNN